MYLVTLLTVLEPVGDSPSTSSPLFSDFTSTSPYLVLVPFPPPLAIPFFPISVCSLLPHGPRLASQGSDLLFDILCLG